MFVIASIVVVLGIIAKGEAFMLDLFIHSVLKEPVH